MKLDIFDAYNIRARLSASVILLAPIAITLFLCIEELRSFASCSVVLFIVVAFTNYVPIIQRRLYKQKAFSTNYAAKMLLPQDTTFDEVTKKRYYKKLASLDETFLLFNSSDNCEELQSCCESAVIYLRSCTRENRLVQEENINYGFCKNLLANKVIGIIICAFSIGFAALYSLIPFNGIINIPAQNWFAFASDCFLLLFWIFGLNETMLKDAAIQYAKALIMAVDTL